MSLSGGVRAVWHGTDLFHFRRESTLRFPASQAQRRFQTRPNLRYAAQLGVRNDFAAALPRLPGVNHQDASAFSGRMADA